MKQCLWSRQRQITTYNLLNELEEIKASCISPIHPMLKDTFLTKIKKKLWSFKDTGFVVNSLLIFSWH